MKPIHASLIAMTGLLALLNSPLRAQEPAVPPASPPPAAPPTPPADRPPPPLSEREKESPRGHHEREKESARGNRDREKESSRRGHERNEESTPFIGVLTEPVPRELRAHFKLDEGFGLLVREVMPDTPAKAAGVKADDVLIRFEDQKLVNMEQLQTLVRSKKKGDVVTLTLISGGAESQLAVTIDERMMPAGNPWERGGRYFGPFGGGSSFLGGDGRNGMRESFERQMREFQERVQKWSQEGGKGPMPRPPSWGMDRREGDRRDGDRRDGDRRKDGDRRGGPEGRRDDRRPGPTRESEVRREHRETANVTRSDDSGIYSLRRENDRRVFTAKPKDGEEKSWDLNNAAEREALPEPMKEKLRQLEEIQGGDKLPTPVPAPAPEKPAAKTGEDV